MSPAVLALCAAYLLHFASGGIQQPLLSPALTSIGFSVAGVGAMWSARSLMMIVSPALWGALSDRVGSTKPLLTATIFFSAALMALLAFAQTEAQGIAIFAVFGLLAAPSGSLMDGTTLSALGEKRAQFGRVRVWGTVGFGLSALVFCWLVDHGVLACTPKVLFPIAALFSLLGGLVIVLSPSAPRRPVARKGGALALLRRRRLVLLIVASSFLWASHGAYSCFLAPLGEAHGAGKAAVGIAMSVALIAEIAAFAVSTTLLRRFGARTVFVACAVVAVLRWTLLATTTSPEAFVLLQALHGITFGVAYSTAVTMLSEDVGDDLRQSAQGLYSSLAFGLGGGAGALISGYALEHGGPNACFLAMAGLATVGVFVASLIEGVAVGDDKRR